MVIVNVGIVFKLIDLVSINLEMLKNCSGPNIIHALND